MPDGLHSSFLQHFFISLFPTECGCHSARSGSFRSRRLSKNCMKWRFLKTVFPHRATTAKQQWRGRTFTSIRRVSGSSFCISPMHFSIRFRFDGFQAISFPSSERFSEQIWESQNHEDRTIKGVAEGSFLASAAPFIVRRLLCWCDARQIVVWLRLEAPLRSVWRSRAGTFGRDAEAAS